MTRTQQALVWGFYAFLAASAITFAYKFGKQDGRAEARGEESNACYCGTTQTCTFGPGVVGVQTCLTSLNKNEWSRCEPDPKWRRP